MKLERAVEILNERKHRFFDRCLYEWNAEPGDAPKFVYGPDGYEALEAFEALAIAEKYEGTADRLAADLAAANERIAALEGERDAAREAVKAADAFLLRRGYSHLGNHIGEVDMLRVKLAAALAPAAPPAP